MTQDDRVGLDAASLVPREAGSTNGEDGGSTIGRLLVANRAEIASRVFRTCRRLGIETVAVCSEADARLPYVREADLVVPLAGNTPAETYLRGDLIVEAAKRAGADAVHPGYGFLSENADFARAVIAAGLTWVGPTPESIALMGSKIEAKKAMAAAGVPVLEGADVAPVLVKASAGGGGRGMRIVRDLAELPAAIAAAEAEAEAAFGDGTVFVEPYVEHGRHVEVQVVGSTVLGERDCSMQRRHQKVVEEAPAPGLPDSVRTALHDAARAAAEAIDYRGAGTVEFLYDPASERFWFLEMNTRLQVEHPVTEAVFGVDLVELQLASVVEVRGRPRPSLETTEASPVVSRLASARTSTTGDGHAVEVRLYAEDPAADYQPQSGALTTLEIPGDVRVDAGYESGSTVSTFYDAMIAKVIAHAPTREQAIRKLAGSLRRAKIHGVTTNRDQLIAILESEEFRSGSVSTDLLGRRSFARSTDDPGAPVAATIALAESARRPGFPAAWRNVTSQPQRTEFETATIEWYGTRSGYAVDGWQVVVVTARDRVVLERDGLRTAYDVTIRGDAVDVDSPFGHTALTRKPRFTDPAAQARPGSLLAPMPGTVVSVAATTGDQVVEGQPLVVLEAMKMQHTVAAPTDGVVAEINVEPGAQVAAGEVLAVVSTGSTTEGAS